MEPDPREPAYDSRVWAPASHVLPWLRPGSQVSLAFCNPALDSPLLPLALSSPDLLQSLLSPALPPAGCHMPLPTAVYYRACQVGSQLQRELCSKHTHAQPLRFCVTFDCICCYVSCMAMSLSGSLCLLVHHTLGVPFIVSICLPYIDVRGQCWFMHLFHRSGEKHTYSGVIW